jgi:hypothetical protein
MVRPLSPDVTSRLRAALQDARFTVSGVETLIGPAAHQATARNETTPALRRTRDGSAISTLTRLWTLQTPVSADDAERALPGLVDPLCVAGLLERSVGEVRALIDVRPYADDDRDWWVVSDLTPGLDGGERRMSPDHVLGVSSASNSLAQLVNRRPVASALDLGTGSGVQSLHLTGHATSVVATDLNPRCLDLAAMTAGLNAVDVDFRLGNLFEPVPHDTFDLIVSNPPFVISPGTGERLIYRDSGLPGDEVVRRVVSEGADHLEPNGWMHVLANWAQVSGQPWTERLGGWISETGCDAWVVQREQIGVDRYVEMWLDDAGLRGAVDYLPRYAAWLDWFDAQRIESIGFGWLTLRKAGRAVPHVTLEEWPYDIAQPLGPHQAAWGDRVDVLDGLSDDALLAARLTREPDVIEERLGMPGEVDPSTIVLRTQRGMRRARQVTTAVAAFVGASDGELSVGQIAGALGTLLARPEPALREELLVAARSLILDEFVTLG